MQSASLFDLGTILFKNTVQSPYLFTNTCPAVNLVTAPPSTFTMDAHSHHHHHHHHGHDASENDIGENNKKHFDNVAADIWKMQWVSDFSEMVEGQIKKNAAWLNVTGNSKMLDYACGNGLASKIFASQFTTLRGIDISSNMVQQYNNEATTNGFPPEKMRAIHADVVNPAATPSEELSTPEFHDFDLIVMGMALHHVANPGEVIQKLSERLAKGGVILIIDWLDLSESGCTAPERKDHPAKTAVSRQGFTTSDMKGYFEAAGLGSAGVMHFDEKIELPKEWGGSSQRAFLGKAQKE